MRRGSVPLLALFAAACSARDPLPIAPAPPPAVREEPRAVPKGTLALADCVAIALERHPLARGAWEAARAAAARVGEEKAAYYPSLDAVAGAARTDTPDLREKGTSPESDLHAGFGVRYLLLDGGLRSARVRGAEAEFLASRFRRDTTLQDVALAVETAYHERLAAQALLEVADERSRQSRTHVELARARHQSGVAARFDVLKAETEKADADLELVRVRSAVRLARGRLAQSMGLRVSESFEIQELPPEVRREEEGEIQRLLDEAAASRPELKVALAQVEARRAEVRAAQAGHWPTLTAGADYGVRDTERIPGREEWWVGVGLQFPLFQGYAVVRRTERAEAELARAVAEREALLRGVELEVWTSHARVLEAGEAIEAARAFVASATEGARVAEGMYRAGTGTILELADSLSSRTAARVRLVQAVLDRHTAVARFERAVGRSLAR